MSSSLRLRNHRLVLFNTRPLNLHNTERAYHRRAPEPSSAEMRELLARYDATPPRPLNLAQLLSCGHPVTPDSVLSSGSYALSELPRRLAARVRHLESLPFIVGTNPYVTKTLNTFKESFQWLATHPPVTNLRENAEFVEQLGGLVQRHANDIPTMAKGFVLCLARGDIDYLTNNNPDFKSVLGTCHQPRLAIFWMALLGIESLSV